MKILELPITDLKRCWITSERGEFLVLINDVVILEADSNYTLLHLRNGRKMMTSKTMKFFEELLENRGFYRVHHSYMINVSCLGNYIKKGGFLFMQNGFQIEVARRRRIEFERSVWKKTA